MIMHKVPPRRSNSAFRLCLQRPVMAALGVAMTVALLTGRLR